MLQCFFLLNWCLHVDVNVGTITSDAGRRRHAATPRAAIVPTLTYCFNVNTNESNNLYRWIYNSPFMEVQKICKLGDQNDRGIASLTCHRTLFMPILCFMCIFFCILCNWSDFLLRTERKYITKYYFGNIVLVHSYI